MLHIKNFIAKVSAMESRMSKDVVIPMSDARGLRDDIACLLADLQEFNKASSTTATTEVIQVEIKGASF